MLTSRSILYWKQSNVRHKLLAAKQIPYVYNYDELTLQNISNLNKQNMTEYISYQIYVVISDYKQVVLTLKRQETTLLSIVYPEDLNVDYLTKK